MDDEAPQKKCLPHIGRRKNQQPHRVVHINERDAPHQGYDVNRTATTKYNVITFFPKALFEQYRRIANIYFTLTAALSVTPWSPVRPWTLFAPLVLVMGVSIVKEGYEDWKRYRADTEVNNRKVKKLNKDTRTFEVATWQSLRVGDIVEVHRDEFFPADLFFLSSDNEEGICYIETMNLDGETNLKIKKCLDETKDLDENSVVDFTAELVCEGPNSRLYQFVGNLKVGEAEVALNPSCILLRGCSLRNTNRILGAIIYAGHETKVFKNSSKPPSKRSRIERMVDKVILFMFGLLFAMCISGAICMAIWTDSMYNKFWYLLPKAYSDQYNPGNGWRVGIISFLTSFMLYGYLIPISLYVSIEIVKLAQALFINQDLGMWHADSDTPALARTSNLNEELGMVNTVLTDKTGTLTRNVMEFFKCSIAGVEYGEGRTEIERANAARHGVVLPETPVARARQYKERFFNFYDHRLMGTAWTQEKHADVIEDFFRLLAVCHTVIPEGPPDPNLIKYEAESPDESALVVAAKVFGFFCHKRTNTTVTVRERTSTGDVDVEYEILNILEFNSTRKRMSVIFRGPDDKIRILCKGADTVIYERMDPTNPQNQRLREITRQQMENFGSAGLRTLCLAQADIDSAYYDEWQQRFIKAKVSMDKREEKLSEVSEEIEKNLVLLGCTAIEDKLQEGVPACIRKLANAGIRIWVLTGDKMETAVNIGYACQLITDEMEQYCVTGSIDEVEQLEMAGKVVEAHKLAGIRVQEQLEAVEDGLAKSENLKSALIIDGKALGVALDRNFPMRRALLLKVGLQCKAVVCCRVSPLQKAMVTHLVKSHGDVTLAIGDGANDVGMIQKAHIGVGISGQEGMQAVLSADFAIAQFRFLERLLLVHGRWSYKRISRMVVFFFYKNLVLGTTIFTYNALALFSGSTIYNDLYMSMYNVVFTALTPIIIGIFDRDVDDKTSLKYPVLYLAGQRNEYFNFSVIVAWFCSAFYQCAIAFSLVMYGARPVAANRENGHVWGKDETGLMMFTVVILTVHLQISTVLDQWTVFHHVAIFGSIFVWWLFMICYGALPLYFSLDLYDLFLGVAAGSPQFWLFLLLVPFACVLPDFFVRFTLKTHHPEIHQIVQWCEAKGVKMRTGSGLENGTGGHETKPLMSPPKRELERRNTGCVPGDSPGAESFFAPKSSLSSQSLNPVVQHLNTACSMDPHRHRRSMSGGSTTFPDLSKYDFASMQLKGGSHSRSGSGYMNADVELSALDESQLKSEVRQLVKMDKDGLGHDNWVEGGVAVAHEEHEVHGLEIDASRSTIGVVMNHEEGRATPSTCSEHRPSQE